MANEITKYATAATFCTELLTAGTNTLKTSPTLAVGDVKVNKLDGNGWVNIGTLPAETAAGSGVVAYSLTDAELTAANVLVRFLDQTATAEWDYKTIHIQTVGHASAAFPTDPTDVVRGGMTALPNAAIGAIGGLATKEQLGIGAVRFVDPAAGNDSNDGLTWATAWESFANVYALASGSTVFVGAGTVSVDGSQTWPRLNIIGRDSNTTTLSLSGTDAIYVDGLLHDLAMTGSPTGWLVTPNSNGLTIDRCSITTANNAQAVGGGTAPLTILDSGITGGSASAPAMACSTGAFVVANRCRINNVAGVAVQGDENGVGQMLLENCVVTGDVDYAVIGLGTVISGDVTHSTYAGQDGLTAQGVTTARAAKLDNLDAITPATGAYTVTITVTDGTAAIVGATVRMTTGTDSVLFTTNGSGVVAIPRNNGTYTVNVVYPGYQLAQQTITVNGANVAQTYAMTATTIDAPVSVAHCTGYLDMYDDTDQLAAGLDIQYYMVSAPTGDGTSFDRSVRHSPVSAANGRLQITTLVRCATYKARRDNGEWTDEFTIPNAASYQLPQVLGRLPKLYR